MVARVRLLGVALLVSTVLLVGCGDERTDTIRLYTSVTEGTVTAVVDLFEDQAGIEVEVFRAPTGEVAARIAAEQREGGIQADVLWLTDPLTMQQYASDGVLEEWDPAGAVVVPSEYSTGTFWGTRILSMVMVQRNDLVVPVRGWDDLARDDYRDMVAIPDPGFAGSALAVLGYFASTPEYGLDYVRRLADNGLVVVNAPGEVVTGVAEGRFMAGITLAFSARNAVEKGSPIEIVWPDSGAVAVYSPIAVVAGASDAARRFLEHVLTEDAQQAIAGTGWQPIRADVAWDGGGRQVPVDWAVLFDQRQDLLDSFQAILDGS
jgi:iron(III) transport system substrate-binding protein